MPFFHEGSKAIPASFGIPVVCRFLHEKTLSEVLEPVNHLLVLLPWFPIP
jgi:hypothetical protein